MRISAVSADGLSEGARTPGVLRELAFELDRATLMRTRAEPNAATGGHHHGDRDVLGLVLSGRARFEFGPNGSEPTDVEEGGFFHVPAGLVHRRAGAGNPRAMANTVRCSGCGMEVEVTEAAERAEEDDKAALTCPTCGAGFDRDGNLRHEPAIGP